MTIRPGEVELEELTALFKRQVDNTQRHPQTPLRAPLLRHVAQTRIDAKIRHQRIHRVGHIEGREPHLMSLDACARHTRNRDIQPSHILPLLITGQNHSIASRIVRRILFTLKHRSHRERKDLDRLSLTAHSPTTRRRQLTSRRRSRDIRGAEADHLIRTRLQIADPREGGQLIGVRNPQNLTRLRSGESPQADSIRQMRIQAPQTPRLQTLRWIDIERPSRPIATKRSMNSGFAVNNSENSSRMMKRAGRGSP